MEIIIPRPNLDYMCSVNSVQHLQRNEAKEIVTHNNTQYVITTYASSGAKGYLWCLAKPVVLFGLYKGSLKPLPYNECFTEVEEGKRERGYNGLLFSCNGKKYVTLTETITFKPSDEGTQIKMF